MKFEISLPLSHAKAPTRQEAVTSQIAGDTSATLPHYSPEIRDLMENGFKTQIPGACAGRSPGPKDFLFKLEGVRLLHPADPEQLSQLHEKTTDSSFLRNDEHDV